MYRLVRVLEFCSVLCIRLRLVSCFLSVLVIVMLLWLSRWVVILVGLISVVKVFLVFLLMWVFILLVEVFRMLLVML